jgi:hypothetical protein
MMFADDLVFLATSQDDLQQSIYNLNKIITKYNTKISTEKTEIVAFLGKKPILSKICTDNRIVERATKFTYLGYILSYEGEVDISNKTVKYIKAIKVKVKLSLCLTKHYAMKTYWGSGGIAPRILDLGTR